MRKICQPAMADDANRHTTDLNRAAWDQASATYQARHQIPLDTVYYGPLAPSERELQLMGDVQGLHILEIGCGGGQSSIALARQGASITGLDLSPEQIHHGQILAAQESVPVTFIQGSAEDLTNFTEGQWDVILSIYALQYVADMVACLAECRRLLRSDGRLIFSLDHPVRSCFWDEEQQAETIYPVRSYFDHRPLIWPFADTGVEMRTIHRTVSQWVELLVGAGFRLQRLLEPPLPTDLVTEPWTDEYTREVAGKLPQTLIVVAIRNGYS
jgi:SAM-dependent methyltransferase